MTQVKVNVLPRPYQVVIESGLLDRVGAHLRELLGDRKRLFVVTVPPVRRRWGKP